jgi:hypothetical protein
MLFAITPEKRQKWLVSWAKNHKIDLPNNIEELPLIQTLDMRGKGLTTLPHEIDCLPNLLELDASNNQLADLPWEFANLKKIKNINLGHNIMADISGLICKMEQLEILNMEANRIKKVNHVIANLTSLRELNLAFNNITDLPNEIGSLRHLAKLNVAGNQLLDLPKGFAKLFNLVELDLWMNKFTQEPEILKELPNIKAVNFTFTAEKINEQLVLASVTNNIALAEKLIHVGADVNFKRLGFDNQEFTTPLFEAHSVEMVKLLVNNGADMHLIRESRKTSSFLIWKSEKVEQESFLTKKHTPEVTKYLKKS